MKKFLSKYKSVLMVAVVAVMCSVPAFAAETEVTTAMTSAFTTIVSDLKSSITAILPIAIGLLGLGMAITFGIKWFKKITGKA